MKVKASSYLTSGDIIDIEITVTIAISKIKKINVKKITVKYDPHPCSVYIEKLIYPNKEEFSNVWKINSKPIKYKNYTSYMGLDEDYDNLYNYIVSEGRDYLLGDILK